MTLVLLYWKQILMAVILGGVSFLGYNHIYDKGFAAASVKYEKQIKEYNDTLNKRIVNLEDRSTVLIEQTLLGNQAVKLDMANLLSTLKGKPLYTIDTKGECKLSPDFIRVYNEGIKKVNK